MCKNSSLEENYLTNEGYFYAFSFKNNYKKIELKKLGGRLWSRLLGL